MRTLAKSSVSALLVVGAIGGQSMFFSSNYLMSLGPADAFIDMAGTAVGTNVTAAIMNAGTISPITSVGAWAITNGGSAASQKVGAYQPSCVIPGSLSVRNTQYTSAHAVQSFALDHTTPFTWATFSLTPGAGINYVAVWGCIKLGMHNISPSGDTYDLVRIDQDSDVDSVMQLNSGNCSGGYGIRTHDPTHFTACIIIPGGEGSTVFYTYTADESTGLKEIRLWQNGVYLGNESFIGVTGHSIIAVKIGNLESGAGGGISYFQNTAISTTNTATYSPIAPYSSSIRHIQSASAKDTSGSATTLAVTPAAATLAGHCMWALALWNSTTQTATVSDTINGAWTAVDSPATVLTNYRMQTFYRCGIASGTPVITLTVTGTSSLITMAFHEMAGVTTLDQHPTANSGSGTTATSATTGTTAAANEYLTGGCATASTSLGNVAGWNGTKEWNATSFSNLTSSVKIVSATGTYATGAIQSSSSGYTCVINTFR